MEFNFSLSDLFPSEISIVGKDLIPLESPGVKKQGAERVKQHMTEVLDVFGKASGVAQSLPNVITSAAKLRESEGEQVVYFLCDFQRNQVVGLCRIGKKKLFIYDQQGVQHELNPLCILDFYIHESKQRMGYGKVLFNAMLQNEKVDVRHLAIDRPSDKLIFFLRKYYQLTKMIPQVYNFVVFDGFFDNRPDYAGKKARWNGLDQTPEKKNTVVVTQFQDSTTYNSDTLIHFRNLQHGYVPQSLASSIGGVVQPPEYTNGSAKMNGNVKQNGHSLHNHSDIHSNANGFT